MRPSCGVVPGTINEIARHSTSLRAMGTVTLTHVASVYRSLGGVESVLRHHHEVDESRGLDSRFVVLCEPADSPVPRIAFLDLHSRRSVREARRRFRAAMAPRPPAVAVYHTMWGMGFLADLDGADKRIVLVHGETPDLRRLAQSRAPWIDGFLCVNERLRELVRSYVPAFDAGRVGVVPYPVLPPFAAPAKAPLPGRPLRVGFCGRLVRVQKRVDRLPGLCAHLEQSGVAFQLEFLGEGPDRLRLERELAARWPVCFHGRQSGEKYWRVLDGWDVIVFVSDFEGTPIALLEALSRGVIPLYPEIGSGGDSYVRKVRAELLYPAWDLPKAAAALARLCQLPAPEIEALRQRCQDAVAGHLGESYIAQFCSFVREILARPRIAQPTFPRRPWPTEYFSLRAVARLAEWRRAWFGWR